MFGGIKEPIEKDPGISIREVAPSGLDLQDINDDLKERMELAEEVWQKKEKQRNFLNRFFRKQHDLGNAEGEIAEMKAEYEKLKLYYEQSIAQSQAHEQSEVEVAENSVESQEKAALPDANIKVLQEMAEEGRSIYAKFPEFMAVDDFKGEIERLEKEKTSLGEEGLQTVQDKLENIKSLDSLRQNFKEAYMQSFKSLVDALLAVDVQAHMQMQNEEGGNLDKILNDLKETMTPVQIEELKQSPSLDKKVIVFVKSVLDEAISSFKK